MNSMERVLTAIGHKEPDRVPLMLLFSIYGAKEMGVGIEEYFNSPDLVVEAQLKLQKKYNNDVLYSFFYAGVEAEAFGGSVIFAEEGPPNTGTPFIKSHMEINELTVPDIKSCDSMNRVLQVTKDLKAAVNDEVPIIGVVMSPFSLPVMQMGFESYLKLMYFEPELFKKLMDINAEFCIKWANAQLEAGATAICYFNPLSSPTIIDKDTYERVGFDLDRDTISQINGPVATHLASGIALPVLDKIMETESLIVGISSRENLSQLKDQTKGKLTLLGNLNGVEMVNWTVDKTETKIKELIKDAGTGGGLIISDNHGEIPWQVSEETLKAIVESIEKWGRYPLDWIGE